MKYNRFGRTGIQVSQLCLGTMTFGNEADVPTANAIMARAADVGINFFDTANIYGKGRCEEIVGKWLKPRRDAFILASKVSGAMSDDPNDRGNSRRNILFSVEKSLRRLDTDRLDVLYLHFWDETTALEQTLAAMTTLVEQGKVLYCGVSNFSAWQTMKAIDVAAANRLAPIVVTQPMYNLVKRQVEVEILPQAQAHGLAVCPYSPIGAGLLTGKYAKGQTGRIHEVERYRERYKNPLYPEVAQRFVAYAADHKQSPAALAAAWVISHPAITSAIVGARNLDQFNDTLGCLDLPMTPEARQAITALSIDPPNATDREDW